MSPIYPNTHSVPGVAAADCVNDLEAGGQVIVNESLVCGRVCNATRVIFENRLGRTHSYGFTTHRSSHTHACTYR